MLFYFQDVEEINQTALKIQLKLTFKITWNDHRLTNINSSSGNYWEAIDVQTVQDNIYIPDLYLYQLIEQTSNSVFGRTNKGISIGRNSTIRQKCFSLLKEIVNLLFGFKVKSNLKKI
jgi:hypothetical protein